MAAIRVVLALIASVAAVVLALPILALGLPFWITALVVRAIAPRLEPPTVRWPGIIAFDPVLGWRPKPDLDVHCLEERDDIFRVRTGPDGWHGTTTIDESDIVVVGDSIAFGYGVDANASFASILSRPRIKALGAPGYNMVQELLVMREVAPKLSGKVVVWLVYPGNDLYDNITPGMNAYRTPFVCERGEAWRIVTSHLSAEKWVASVGRGGGRHFPALAALHAPTYLADRAYRAAGFLIEQGAALCADVGARLIVAVVPSPLVLDAAGLALLRSNATDPTGVDPDLPDRRIAESCAKIGVEFLPLKAHLERRHFKPYDDHWTEAGHRVVARVIASTLERGPAA